MSNSPYFSLKADIQSPNRAMHCYVFCGDTPKIRVWLYRDGEKWTPDSDWTAELGYGEDFEFSTAIVTVTGYPGYSFDSSSSSSNSSDDWQTGTDYNYFDFDLESADISTPGDYYLQIIVRNALDTERYVFGTGMLHVKDSPIGGSHTDLVLTSQVNWDNITNLGTVPWDSSTAVIIDDDCSVNPIECAYLDHGKTWIWEGACDMTYTLPAVSTSQLGSIYKFINLTSYVLTVRAQSGELIDTYPAMYTGQGSVNTNPSYSRGSVVVKQITNTTYGAIEGRGTWTYLLT